MRAKSITDITTQSDHMIETIEYLWKRHWTKDCKNRRSSDNLARGKELERRRQLITTISTNYISNICQSDEYRATGRANIGKSWSEQVGAFERTRFSHTARVTRHTNKQPSFFPWWFPLVPVRFRRAEHELIN